MGNSVAVPVVKKVAEQMIEALRESRVLKKEAKSA
jgi:site-specific DNA-cytosine methylase